MGNQEIEKWKMENQKMNMENFLWPNFQRKKITESIKEKPWKI